MESFNVLCSIHGFDTEKNKSVAQVKIEYSGNESQLSQYPSQLDCFWITINSTDMQLAFNEVKSKLKILDEQLVEKYADFDLTHFECDLIDTKEIDEAIEIKELSLRTITGKSKMLQEIENGKA